MRRPAQLFYVRLLLAVAGGLFCAALSWFDWVQPLDRVIYDIFNEAAPLPPADDIIIVGVDEASLRELGRWPWPRENHVELLRQLRAAEVAAVAIDMIFAESYQDFPEVDQLFAREVEELGTTILPVFIARGGTQRELHEIKPVQPLADAAAGLGHVHIEVDSDGVARTVYLREGLGEPRWPHFSVALAQVLGIDLAPLPGISDQEVLQDPNPNAIIRSHANLIPLIGDAGSVEHVSYVSVMKGRAAKDDLRDKIIFVGATAAGHVDNITTSRGQISGVEINVNIFHALRSSRLAQPLAPFSTALLAFFVIGLTIFGFTRLTPGNLLIAVMSAAIITPLASYLVLYFLRIWISPAAMLVTLLFAYPLWNWLRLAAAMDFIQGHLAQLENENRQWSFRSNTEQDIHSETGDPVENILTQLERASREARHNHELIRGTLEQLASGVILAEPSGEILFANDLARSLVKLSGQENNLQNALKDISLDEGLKMASLLGSLGEAGDKFTCEGFSNSRERDLLLQGGLIGIESAIVVMVLTDVSELKQSEKRRGEALNFLSHDLRAPLTSVLALIESATENSPQNTDLQLLRQIEKYIEANLSYAENFIQLAKLEQSTLPRFDECEGQSLLDNAVAQLYHSAAKRHIELCLVDTAHDLWLNCSRDLVERVLINLIDNAIKHSDDGTVIHIGFSKEDEWGVFTVSDQGQGISPEDLQRIFDRFHQGEHARTGAGLGLRFVHAVARAHGGSISASNLPSGGSCFTLRLPHNHT